MAKTDLGTKRLCESCESKFYDLGRTPIVCPKCGTTFVEAKPAPKPKKPVEKKTVDKAETVEAKAAPDSGSGSDAADGSAEIVSLEEADEERGGGDDDSDDETVVDGDNIDVSDIVLDDDNDDNKAQDNTFLEADEDENPNVADLVGGAGSDDQG